MKRREFFIGAGSMAAGLALASRSVRAEEKAHDHGEHKHAADPAPMLTKVAGTATACVAAGKNCIRHCVDLLGQGEESMQACLQSALAMAAVCEAMAAVASYGTTATPDIRALAETCARFCNDCAEACKPHVDHHAVCKACMESCLACSAACEQLATSA
jgi:Cys-rich four helix bundle protein (predicted Tat secretion target)